MIQLLASLLGSGAAAGAAGAGAAGSAGGGLGGILGSFLGGGGEGSPDFINSAFGDKGFAGFLEDQIGLPSEDEGTFAQILRATKPGQQITRFQQEDQNNKFLQKAQNQLADGSMDATQFLSQYADRLSKNKRFF